MTASDEIKILVKETNLEDDCIRLNREIDRIKGDRNDSNND